jgi:DNA-binding NtrC family response regulator
MPACWREVLRSSGWSYRFHIWPLTQEPMAATGDLLKPLAEQMAELETRAIRAAMQAHGATSWQWQGALGISRAKLYDRLEKLNF